MGKVTELKVATPGRNQGTFKVRNFNMFKGDDLEAYAELRNKANDASSGVRIEMMREYTRKQSETAEGAEGPITRSWEDIILVVQYWEKDPKRVSTGENDGIDKALASAAK